jgi:hypothetical protein
LPEHKDWDGSAILKECEKQERSRQYTPGNPQTDQQEDKRHAGRMMLKKIYRI